MGVYDVFTLPQYRNNGYAMSMMHAVLKHAKQLGYKTAVLSASAMGMGIYRRLGFSPCCAVHVYERAASLRAE